MNNRILYFISLDIIIVLISLIGAFWIRFDFIIPKHLFELVLNWIPIFSLSQIIIFMFTDLYKRIWKFTSIFDLVDIIKSVIFSSTVGFFIIFILSGSSGYPRSVLLLFFILNLIMTCLSRVAVRIYNSHIKNRQFFKNEKTQKKLILVGAGRTGEKIAREIINLAASSPYKIIGYVDDDTSKIGHRLHGFKVLGQISEISQFKELFDEVLICAPKATGEQVRNIVDICKKIGKRYKTVPTLVEMIDKDITLDSIRDVSYVDLLGRAEVKLDMNSIEKFLNHKRILISGAGGSIGSELLNQCLNFKASEVICLDFNEEKVFELDTKYSGFDTKSLIKPILVNINNVNELRKVFYEIRPQVVFHAAAYKHVPIQELSPWTAVSTNVAGTLNMVELSHEYNVEKFVLVSTDKAVNPVNIMGATKRIAEKIIQSINFNSKTQFMAVRFGNVLGSSGSAIPKFQEQINNGGPITVTHPEMTRYFMSIPEASQLILQCGSYGKDGEIFLLNMGKPIKITNIARDLIKLSGYEPEVDIPIVYTGLRPGEKLYEELSYNGELKLSTRHKKIMKLKDRNLVKSWDEFKVQIQELIRISNDLDSDKIQSALENLLSTYKPRILMKNLSNENKIDSPFSIKGEA